MNTHADPPIQPWDAHNQRLASHVHPADWTNPEPAKRYNLVVVGGGVAGLVAAVGAAGLGARVALVEKHFLGGDCLNAGCVPSKALLRSARAAAAVRDAGEFGVRVPPGVAVDFSAVMERMRRLRADISPHDSARRLASLGVDVFLGAGRFGHADTIEVGGRPLRFAKAVIATGARPSSPAIPGLDQVAHLTNETLFSLTQLPRRLGVVGAGPIGCEMAQAFARFGSEVWLVESSHGLLPREEREAAALVADSLQRDGVRLLCCGKDLRIAKDPAGIRLRLESHGAAHDLVVDHLLVAAGRTPNIENMGLEVAGVEFNQKGIRVDDHLRTTNPRVFACGDVCSSFQFTHAADFMARIVIQNALFFGRAKHSALTIPWTTHTSPELAHVGLGPAEAEAKGIAIQTHTQPMSGVDRAILDGETGGFVRIHTPRGTDQILGATIVAEQAGDLIGEIALAMRAGIGLRGIASTIHPYPTHAEAIRKVGDQHNRSRLTPFVKALLARWMAWRR